jgi:hypothetical protein
MSIAKSGLQTSISEVLADHLPEATDKDRTDLRDALVDRMTVDFDVYDDDDEDADEDADEDTDADIEF